MEANSIWFKEHKDRQGNAYPIWAISNHDQSHRVAVSVGPEILIYHSQTSQLVQSLKGHKDTVQSLDWAKDGHLLVSGGEDKQVILWNKEMKAFLKYSHRDPIVLVSIGPIHGRVLSFCASEMVLWTPNVKGLQRQNLNTRVISCSWSLDGQFICLGHYDGTISIRNKDLEEVFRMMKGNNTPVLAVAWNPNYHHSDHRQLEDYADSKSKEKSQIPAFVAVDGNRILSFYSLDGSVFGKEKRLKCQLPTTIDTFSSSTSFLSGRGNHPLNFSSSSAFKTQNLECFAIASEDGEVEFWTWEGVRVWHYQLLITKSALSKIKLSSSYLTYLFTCTKTGQLSCYQLKTNQIITQCKDRVAYRDGWSDVIVFNTTSLQRARIRCRDFIKFISLYKNYMAIGLVDRIIVYGCVNDSDMHYKIKAKLSVSETYSACRILQQHVFICEGNIAIQKTFEGETISEWGFSNTTASLTADTISRSHQDCLKLTVKQKTTLVIGGPTGKEMVYIGLSNGKIYKVQMGNPLITLVAQLHAPITQISLSSDKRLLSVVDDLNQLSFIDCIDHKMINSMSDQRVTKVLWHQHHPKLMAMIKEGRLYIRLDEFSVGITVIPGEIAHFSLNQILVFDRSNQLNPLYVSLTSLFYQIAFAHTHESKAFSDTDFPLETKELNHRKESELHFKHASRTENLFSLGMLSNAASDWKQFGQYLLYHQKFDEAKRAFQLAKEFPWIEVVKILHDLKDNQILLRSMVLLCSGKVEKSIQSLIKSKNINSAVNILIDLQRFDEASKLASQYNIQGDDILLKQADILLEMDDRESAVLLYAQCGHSLKAVELAGSAKMVDLLCKLSESIDSKETRALQKCSQYLSSLESNHPSMVRPVLLELYKKVNDQPKLIQALLKEEKWQEALEVAGESTETLRIIAAPYTQYLLANNRFEEAKEMMLRSGDFGFCVQFLEQLIHAAELEHRYKDAAYYSLTLANEYLNKSKHMNSRNKDSKAKIPTASILTDKGALNYLHLFQHYRLKVILYRAYEGIHQYVFEPFTEYQDLHVLYMARFLLCFQSESWLPSCVRLDAVIYAATKICFEMRSWESIQYLHQREFLFPKEWKDEIDTWILVSSSALNDAPLTLSHHGNQQYDNNSLKLVCYGCGIVYPLMKHLHHSCLSCKEPIQVSIISFLPLPLVQCIIKDESHDVGNNNSNEATAVTSSSITGKIPSRSNYDKANNDLHSIFDRSVLKPSSSSISSMYEPISLTRSQFEEFEEELIRIENPIAHFPVNSPSLTACYNKVIDLEPETIIKCPECEYLFFDEEWEFQYISIGHCPICKSNS